MARRFGRSRVGQEAVGFLLAQYLRLVQTTSRFTTAPADLDAFIAGKTPLIAAMWHGQHLMTPLARPATMGPLAVLISRHEDAGAQALAAKRLGIEPVRGSGGPFYSQHYKGGAPALRELLRLLEAGSSVALTADALSRRLQFHTWDRATLGLPFGRAAVVVSDLIEVQPGADESAMEAARLAVQNGLDAAHRKAYAMVGAADPGADLRRE